MPSFKQTGAKVCPNCKGNRKKKICEVCGTKTKPSGKWSVCFDLPEQKGKQRVQKRLSGFSSRTEANLAYIEFFSKYEVPTKNIAADTTVFKDVYDRFFLFQMSRTKESSFSSTEGLVGLHILPHFENHDVLKIMPVHIIAWQAWLNKKLNLSGRYKNKILAHLRAFFYYCVDIEQIIKENPCSKKLKFVVDAPKEEMLIYSPEEYAQFREAIDNFQDAVLFDAFYYTGMRKGELIALQWTDFRKTLFSVTKTFSRKRSKKSRELNLQSWKITSPKGKNSVRDVLLPKFLIAELEELKKSKQAKESDYIFGNVYPASEKNIDNARDKYYKAAEVKRIRIHDFRHSHVSYLISINTDIMAIARRVGDTPETVLKTYAHLLPNKQIELVNNLETLVPKKTTSEQVCEKKLVTE